MDRMLYIAMSGARETMLAQAANTNNLANASTTGFKADLTQARSMPMFGPGMPTRVYAMTERPAIDLKPGTEHTTGRDLDIAVRGQGWIAVQTPNGGEAYTRAGNLRLTSTGMLTTATGLPVLGNSGAPISIPQAQKVEIGGDGTISIRPMGQSASALVEVDRIKLVNPPSSELIKGQDGLIHLKGGGKASADANVSVISGALEGSNVSPVSALVNMIELARQYETQVKMMKTADEDDRAASQLLTLA